MCVLCSMWRGSGLSCACARPARDSRRNLSKTDGDGGDGDGDGGGGDVKQIENRASARPTRCFKLILS